MKSGHFFGWAESRVGTLYCLKFEWLPVNFQDKPTLFRSFYKWLKPGGKVLISDYCKNAGTPSPEFAEYIKQRGYDLHDVKSYGHVCLHLKTCLISRLASIFSPVVSPYFLDIANSCLTVVQMLGDAGFDDVIAEDRTDQVCEDLCLCMC